MKKAAETARRNKRTQDRNQVPKLCGADVELGNFILGLHRPEGTCYEASHALLREIDGLPQISKHHAPVCACQLCRPIHGSWEGYSYGQDVWRSDYPYVGKSTGSYQDSSRSGSAVYDPQDWGRKFLPTNGGCAYIDLNHLELCVPEVLRARDHVAVWHAMLRIARQALDAANAKLPPGQRIQLLVANSDGQSHSFGSHLNILISRAAWNNLFDRKLHQMLFLAAYQISSLIFTGAGKVGSENGRPAVDFQISQRADFIETLTGSMTTSRRPVINSRNEPLCGLRTYEPSSDQRGSRLARLHVIFYDATLSEVSNFLKVGVMQIILSMIEAQYVNPYLVLDDPLDALGRWSHDPTLTVRAKMISGRKLSALELQFQFLEQARRFVQAGGCSGTVPDCEEILNLWEDTLVTLESRELARMARRVDWALKLLVIKQAMEQRPALTWASPEIKHLDQIFGSIDPLIGLYWAYERSGFLERIITDDEIENFIKNPPTDTRAWTRAMLLRRAQAGEVDDVDWDFIEFRLNDQVNAGRYRRLDMASPLEHTEKSNAGVIQGDGSLADILDALGATDREDQSQQIWNEGWRSTDGGPAHSGNLAEASTGRSSLPAAEQDQKENSLNQGGRNGHETT